MPLGVKKCRAIVNECIQDVFGEDSEYDVGRQLAAEFIDKTGLTTFPQVKNFSASKPFYS